MSLRKNYKSKIANDCIFPKKQSCFETVADGKKFTDRKLDKAYAMYLYLRC